MGVLVGFLFYFFVLVRGKIRCLFACPLCPCIVELVHLLIILDS